MPDSNRASRLHEAQPSDVWQSFWDEIARLEDLSRTAQDATAAQQYEDYSREHLTTFTDRLIAEGFQADPFRVGVAHANLHVRGHIAGKLDYICQHDPNLGAELAAQLLTDSSHLVRQAAIETLEHYLTPEDAATRPSFEESKIIIGALAAGATVISRTLGELESSIEHHPSQG